MTPAMSRYIWALFFSLLKASTARVRCLSECQIGLTNNKYRIGVLSTVNKKGSKIMPNLLFSGSKYNKAIIVISHRKIVTSILVKSRIACLYAMLSMDAVPLFLMCLDIFLNWGSLIGSSTTVLLLLELSIITSL